MPAREDPPQEAQLKAPLCEAQAAYRKRKAAPRSRKATMVLVKKPHIS